MRLEDQWAAAEQQLAREAESLGEILAQLRGHISPVLIEGTGWERLLERARDLPATMAAFPFGFELPLHERRPGGDLGVSVVGGTASAAYFEEQGRSEGAVPSAAGIARLLDETKSQRSLLREVVGRKLMLEYDIESAPGDERPAPGIFLRPAERPIVGDGASQRIRDIGCVLDAIVSAAGWRLDAAEHRQVERLYRAQTPDMRIDSFGVFPSRDRSVRLAVTGLQTSRDVMAFLERAAWSGERSAVASTVSHFENRGAFVNMGVHFDVHADGLGPKLGLSFLAKNRKPNDPRYWVDSPRQWTAFLNGLGDAGLGDSEKLSALAGWSAGAQALFCGSGTFVLMRGIHHIKLVLTGDRFEQAKAYVFLLVCSWPEGGAPAR